MYFWFDIYRKRPDKRIWRSRCIVLASGKKDAEKKAKEPISNHDSPILLIVFRKKAEDYNSNVFKPAHKGNRIQDCIPSPEELREVGLETPENQTAPLDIPEEPEPVVEEEEFEERKFELAKCQYCGGDVPKNGAAQFSHLRKHVNELVKRGILTPDEAKKIRKVKLEPRYDRLFKQEIGKE
jgi:hypothetical protein